MCLAATSVLECIAGFVTPVGTPVWNIVAACQCTPSGSPWKISLPLLYRFLFGFGMKPGGLAQCLPVVSATGI